MQIKTIREISRVLREMHANWEVSSKPGDANGRKREPSKMRGKRQDK